MFPAVDPADMQEVLELFELIREYRLEALPNAMQCNNCHIKLNKKKMDNK